MKFEQIEELKTLQIRLEKQLSIRRSAGKSIRITESALRIIKMELNATK